MSEYITAENPEVTLLSANKDLLLAVEEQGVPEIRAALNKGADINHFNEAGRWPLLAAITKGRPVEVIEAVIAAGANLTLKTSSGQETALHRAVEQKAESVLSLLIAAGHPIDPRNDNYETPLICATMKNAVGLARVLIAAGANPNAMDKNGSSPLHRATSAEMVDVLVEADADMDQVNVTDATPVGTAVMWRRIEVLVRLVQRGGSVNRLNERLAGPLMVASGAAGSQAEAIDILCDAGANLEEVNKKGQTPLHNAISYLRQENCAHLIHRGASFEHRDIDGKTALLAAASVGCEEMVALLAGVGADMTVRDNRGKGLAEYASDYPELKPILDAWRARQAMALPASLRHSKTVG